ncbi:MAG TPA: CBS domain-containing protein [Steroidobacteraceae bacterium]|nr:CBS domain-containing protein [Steroidobacteraceae bacterium]
MRTTFTTVRPNTPLPALVEALQTAPFGLVFMVDDKGVLAGVISVADLAPVADSVILGGLPLVAADLAQPRPIVLEASDDPRRALRLMEARMGSHLPVVQDRASMRLVGVADVHELVLAYHKALLQARAEERGEVKGRRHTPRRHAAKRAPGPAPQPPGRDSSTKAGVGRPKVA